MSRLRVLPTRRLLALLAAAVATLAVGATIAIAATSGGSKPPPSALDAAVSRALSAPKVAGISARVRFDSSLIDGAAAVKGDPLISGASGRLWAAADGRMRLELQADQGGSGDAQIGWDGTRLTVFEPSANTIYRYTPPADSVKHEAHATPSLGDIDRVLAKIGTRADLSGATPATIAGRPAYSVRVTPKDRSGLLGGAALAWDAATGVPLRASVYARGSSDPVLDLTATDVSYGSVPDSDLAVAVPAGAKVVELDAKRGSTPKGRDGLTVHGRGLGAVAVFATPARAGHPAKATTITTPLGSIVTLTRNGSDYVVAGLVPLATVQAVARGL